MSILNLVLFALGYLVTSSDSRTGCPSQGRAGEFSRLSVDLCFQNVETQQRQLEIPSPDHSLQFVVKGKDGQIYAQDQKVGPLFGVLRDEEIIWSADSRAILFTLSFGASGPVSADFAGVRDTSHDRESSVTETIRADFASHHARDRCHQEANVGGLTWLDGSEKAVLIAEVPPSPQCEKDGGYFESYVVSFPSGKVLARYSMKETVRRWHDILGSRLEDDIKLLKDN